MKRFAATALALGLTALLCVNALAVGSAEIVRAFVYNGTLYTYIAMDGVDQPITKAEAKLSGQTFSVADRLETVRQAGAPVTWLLLVDNSTSMPDFREDVDGFARRLAQSSEENTKFILASFGDTFQIVSGDVSPDQLAEEMEGLPLDERVTRLHTAIDQALDYFEDLPRERNELRCMVILSDAVQYDPAGGIPYEELLERVSRSDVMLHSVGLGGDQEALDSLGRLVEASGGLHQTVKDRPVEEITNGLIASSNGLFVAGFDLSGYTCEGGTQAVSITFVSGGELICRAEAQVELPELTGAPETQTAPALPGTQTPATNEAALSPEQSSSPTASEGQGMLLLLIAAAVLASILAVGIWLRRK